MDTAHYEITEEKTIYGEIPSCAGVYASAPTLEACRKELEETLEEWLIIRIHHSLELPEINGHQLKIPKEIIA